MASDERELVDGLHRDDPGALAALFDRYGDRIYNHCFRRLGSEARMRAVLAQVEALPEREREVLGLVAWAGLSYEQAAAALDVPVGTVRSRLSRARARLTDLTEENLP